MILVKSAEGKILVGSHSCEFFEIMCKVCGIMKKETDRECRSTLNEVFLLLFVLLFAAARSSEDFLGEVPTWFLNNEIKCL